LPTALNAGFALAGLAVRVVLVVMIDSSFRFVWFALLPTM